MTIFSSPRGLNVLSLVLLAGCGDGGDNKQAPAEPPQDAQVSISVGGKHTITNVRRLVLRVSPVYLTQSDGSYIRLLSDESGRNISEEGGAHRDITIINRLESNPIPSIEIASFIPLSGDHQGGQRHVRFAAWGLSGLDSYVELDDGRYCDIHVVMDADNDPRTEGDAYEEWTLSDVTINGGERWRINIEIGYSSTFNANRCAEEQDFPVYLTSATAERM